MASFQRALLANGFFFQISNSFSNYWPKTEKYSNEQRGVNIELLIKVKCIIYQWI